MLVTKLSVLADGAVFVIVAAEGFSGEGVAAISDEPGNSAGITRNAIVRMRADSGARLRMVLVSGGLEWSASLGRNL